MPLPLAAMAIPEVGGLGAYGLSRISAATGNDDITRWLNAMSNMSMLYQLGRKAGAIPTPPEGQEFHGMASDIWRSFAPMLGMHMGPTALRGLGMAGMAGRAANPGWMTQMAYLMGPMFTGPGAEDASGANTKPKDDTIKTPVDTTNRTARGGTGPISNEDLIRLYNADQTQRGLESQRRLSLATMMGEPQQYLDPGYKLMNDANAAPFRMAGLYEAMAAANRLGGRKRPMGQLQ